MSRHIIIAENSPRALKIVIGWDPPLQTYFAQVHDPTKNEEDEIVFWVGTRPEGRAITNEHILSLALSSYGVTLTDEILESLREDKRLNRA